MVKITTNVMNFLKNLFYTKNEVDTKLNGKSNTSHSHSDDDVSVTTANYGEGINQNTFNGYLSYDMLTVKEKLNGIDEGANKTTVDSSLSSSSTNPVQNKVINSALSEKAASSHTHLGREIYPDFSVDSDGVSTAAYRKIFRITITKGYCDEPITFNLSQRREAMHSRIHITFKTASGKDPDLDSFYIEGIKSMPLYLYKEDASKWILLSKEVSNYDHVSINELLVTNRSRDYFTLTPLNELVTTLPTSDIYTATNTIDSSLSSTSTNAVQNKVINSALSGKADSSHTHTDEDISTEGSLWDDVGITKQWQINNASYNVYNKVLNIDNGANKYTLPTASSSTLGGVKVGTNLSISNGVLSATNTTYGTATTSANGLMSSSDKSKLDGITAGANKITVDSSLSSSSTNPVQNKVINSALSGKASTSVATTSANGLMSSSDKTKLNGIATGATKVTVDSSLSSTSTNPVQNKVINTALAGKAATSHVHGSDSATYIKLDSEGTMRLYTIGKQIYIEYEFTKTIASSGWTNIGSFNSTYLSGKEYLDFTITSHGGQKVLLSFKSTGKVDCAYGPGTSATYKGVVSWFWNL